MKLHTRSGGVCTTSDSDDQRRCAARRIRFGQEIMETSRQHNALKIAFWTLLFLSPLPGLAVYVSWLGELEQYGYVLPLFLALAAFVLFRWDYRLHWPSDGCSLSLVGFGAVLTVLAAYRNSPWFSAVGFSC